MEVSRRQTSDTLPRILPSIAEAPSRKRGRPKEKSTLKKLPKIKKVCDRNQAGPSRTADGNSAAGAEAGVLSEFCKLPVVDKCSALHAVFHILDMANVFGKSQKSVPRPMKEFVKMVSSGVYNSSTHTEAIRHLLKDTDVAPGECAGIQIALDAFSCIYEPVAGFERYGERRPYLTCFVKDAVGPQNQEMFTSQLKEIEDSGRLLILFVVDREDTCSNFDEDSSGCGMFMTLYIDPFLYELKSAVVYSKATGHRVLVLNDEKYTIVDFARPWRPARTNELSRMETQLILAQNGCAFLYERSK